MKFKAYGLNFNIFIIGMTIIYLILFWSNILYIKITLICWTIIILLMSLIKSLEIRK